MVSAGGAHAWTERVDEMPLFAGISMICCVNERHSPTVSVKVLYPLRWISDSLVLYWKIGALKTWILHSSIPSIGAPCNCNRCNRINDTLCQCVRIVLVTLLFWSPQVSERPALNTWILHKTIPLIAAPNIYNRGICISYMLCHLASSYQPGRRNIVDVSLNIRTCSTEYLNTVVKNDQLNRSAIQLKRCIS